MELMAESERFTDASWNNGSGGVVPPLLVAKSNQAPVYRLSTSHLRDFDVANPVPSGEESQVFVCGLSEVYFDLRVLGAYLVTCRPFEGNPNRRTWVGLAQMH